MASRGEEMRRVEEALWNAEATSDAAALQSGAAGDAAESQPKAAPAASQPSAQPTASGQQEAGTNRKRRASSFGGAVSPADLSPDSIMREISRLGAVIQRAVRPRSDGGRPMQVLVRLALHESAMRDGFVQRELSQAELAELIGIRPQSIGPILVKLEEEGLIERRPSQADRQKDAAEQDKRDEGRAPDDAVDGAEHLVDGFHDCFHVFLSSYLRSSSRILRPERAEYLEDVQQGR